MVMSSTTLCLHHVLQHAISACRCSIDAAHALHSELVLWKQKLDAVGDWCNRKSIQSVYFRYNISKFKRSLFARCHTPSTLLSSSSFECYVDANSSRWRHSFVTFVHFKLYFYGI